MMHVGLSFLELKSIIIRMFYWTRDTFHTETSHYDWEYLEKYVLHLNFN